MLLLLALALSAAAGEPWDGDDAFWQSVDTASAAYARRDYAVAAENLADAYERQPDFFDVESEVAMHAGQAEEFAAAGELEKAVGEMALALALRPRDPQLSAAAAQWLLEGGDLAAAKALAQRALKAKRTAWEPRSVLAGVYAAEGDHERAVRHYQRVLRDVGGDAATYVTNELGVSLAALGESEAAAAAFVRSVGLADAQENLLALDTDVAQLLYVAHMTPLLMRHLGGDEEEALFLGAQALQMVERREFVDMHQVAATQAAPACRRAMAGMWAGLEPGDELATHLAVTALPRAVLALNTQMSPVLAALAALAVLAAAGPADLGREDIHALLADRERLDGFLGELRADIEFIRWGCYDANCTETYAGGQQCYADGVNPSLLQGNGYPPMPFVLPGFCGTFTVELLNENTWPQYCAPEYYCALDMLANGFCDPQGYANPFLMWSGMYCPESIPPMQEIVCPEGSYCPMGSEKPIACGWMESCPEWSHHPTFYGGLLICGILDGTLLLAYVAFWYRQRSQQTRMLSPDAHKKDDDDGELEAPLIGSSADEGAEDGDDDGDDDDLARGFLRARRHTYMLDFQFQHLSLTLPSGATILSDVSGRLAPGTVTAIMGPSGAGKTTFLSTLLDKLEAGMTPGGSLRINGRRSRGTSEHRHAIGWVPQTDTMTEELSVWDNVYFSARVRLPSSWTAPQVRDHVRAILKALDLSHVAGTIIGTARKRGVSGGQRKRVNIAMELAAAPVALFLDEPTSGLDSTAALRVTDLLKSLARKTATTIALVVHQPRIDIFESLDQLLLLAPGGKTVFQGAQADAAAYFADELDVRPVAGANPADSYMDAIGARGDDFARRWTGYIARTGRHSFSTDSAASEAAADSSAQGAGDDAAAYLRAALPSPDLDLRQSLDDAGVLGDVDAHARLLAEAYPDVAELAANLGRPRAGAGLAMQTALVARRSLKQQVFTVTTLVLELATAAVAGVVMGEAGNLTFQGVLVPPYTLFSPAPLDWVLPMMSMFVSMTIGLAGGPASVNVFGGPEQIIYFREAAAGHSRVAYYLGKTLASVPRVVIVSLHFATTYHILAHPLIAFSDWFVLTLLTYFAVTGVGTVISLCTPFASASLVTVVAVLVFSCFNGFIEAMPYDVEKFSFSFYLSEAFMSLNTEHFRSVYLVEDVSAPSFNYTLDRVGHDQWMLVLSALAFRVVGFGMLVGLNRAKQR